jgi:hypothetical protein
MFTSLYELILGQNNDPIYSEEIFGPVGFMTLMLALVVAAVFYVLLGRWKPVFDNIVHWVITLIAVGIFGFGYALWFALDRTGADETDGYMQGFGAVNALFALIFFFVFSVILKRFSIFAKRTPF